MKFQEHLLRCLTMALISLAAKYMSIYLLDREEQR